MLDALYMLTATNALSEKEAMTYIRRYPCNRDVFLFPPWEDIYTIDEERDQTWSEAADVYIGLKHWYLQHGYELIEVPKTSVISRAAFIINHIEISLRSEGTGQ